MIERKAIQVYKKVCEELEIPRDECINFIFSDDESVELYFSDGRYYNTFKIFFDGTEGVTQLIFQKFMNKKKFIYSSTECLVSTANLSPYGIRDEELIITLRIIEQILKAITSTRKLETHGIFYDKIVYKTTIGLDEVYCEKTIRNSFMTNMKKDLLEDMVLTNTICCLLKRELYEKMYGEKIKMFTSKNNEIFFDINYVNSILIYLAVYKIAKQKEVTVLDYLLDKLINHDRYNLCNDIYELYDLNEENILRIFSNNLAFQSSYFYISEKNAMRYTKVDITKYVNFFLNEILKDVSFEEEAQIKEELKQKLRGPFFKYIKI